MTPVTCVVNSSYVDLLRSIFISKWFFIYLIYSCWFWQWNDEHQNSLAQDISERVAEMVRVLNVNSSEDSNHFRQLPPSIVDIEGRRGAFPLALGHAVDYIAERAALIG